MTIDSPRKGNSAGWAGGKGGGSLGARPTDEPRTGRGGRRTGILAGRKNSFQAGAGRGGQPFSARALVNVKQISFTLLQYDPAKERIFRSPNPAGVPDFRLGQTGPLEAMGSA